MVQKKSGKEDSRSASEVSQPITLPKPSLQSSLSLAKAFELRRTIREFRSKKLPLQIVASQFCD